MTRAVGVPNRFGIRYACRLSRRLAAARIAAGMTQREAGDAIGVPSYSISYIEGCENDDLPSFARVMRLATAYGIDPLSLLDDHRHPASYAATATGCAVKGAN